MGTSAFDGPCIRDSVESFSHGRIRLKGKVFLWLFSGHPPGSYLLMASLDQQDNKKKHLRNTHTADRDTAESGRGLTRMSDVFESNQI